MTTGDRARPPSGPPRGPLLHPGWYDQLGHGPWGGSVGDVGVVLSLAALVAWALAQRRLALGLTRRRAWATSLADVALVGATLGILRVTLSPVGSRTSGTLSLVPLHDLTTTGPFEVAGNLLLFAAWGALGPLRFPARATTRRVVAVAAMGSISVETAQYLLPLGRVASVDDVLLNTAGAALAAVVVRAGAALRPRGAGPDPRLSPEAREGVACR